MCSDFSHGNFIQHSCYLLNKYINKFTRNQLICQLACQLNDTENEGNLNVARE